MNTLFRCVAVAIAAATLAGCKQPPQIMDRADYMAEATRVYHGVNREQIIQAAEVVLKHSDPQDWDFRYDQAGFVGLRRYFIYAVFAAASGQEKWQFTTEAVEPAAIRASVSISEAGVTSGGYSGTPYEGAMNSIPLYRLFWQRVDYMLGKRPDWVSCKLAREELAKTKTAAGALGGLCGGTSQGANKPAPPPIGQGAFPVLPSSSPAPSAPQVSSASPRSST